MANPVFKVDHEIKKAVIVDLLDESKDGTDFYLMLGAATIIATIGILLDSVVVLIGGMLVAPLLFPLLSLSLAVTQSSRKGILRALKIIVRSSLFVLVIAMVTAFLLGREARAFSLVATTAPSLSLFIIAFAAGIVAAYTSVRHSLSSALPGVAVAVTLLPPLVAVGVGLVGIGQFPVADPLLLFILNLVGVVFAALLVFSLFGMAGARHEFDKAVIKEEAEVSADKAEKKKEEAVEALKDAEAVIEEVKDADK